MTNRKFIATSPGSIGNIGPGLDVLGCALSGLRDEVAASWWGEPGVTLLDTGHADLPASPLRHTSAIAATAVMKEGLRLGMKLEAAGVALRVKKNLPLSGGQGGSAASAVAGAVATNALLGNLLDTNALLQCCLEAEATVAGRHLDNIAPILLGGIVLVRSIAPIEVVSLPVPTGLHLVLVRPEQRLSTALARQALPKTVPLPNVTHQIAHVGAMVAACFLDDLALFGRSIDDRIAEPARASLIPGFVDAKIAALEAGALGASISGAGPTAFAVVASAASGNAVAKAMQMAYSRQGIICTTIITEVDVNGTIVTSSDDA